MAFQFVEGELIHIQLSHLRLIDDEIALGLLREILDFIELIGTDITPKTFTILYNLTSKIRTNSWHCLQYRRISSIQDDMLRFTNLYGIVGITMVDSLIHGITYLMI